MTAQKTALPTTEARHRYLFEWDEPNDDYANSFTVSPVGVDTMQVALEQWNIWRKWELAFKRGVVPHSSHPGFGGIDARYDQLTSMLKSIAMRWIQRLAG